MKKLILLLPALFLISCNATTESLTKDMGAIGGSILSSLPSLGLDGGEASNNEISQAFKQALTIGTGNLFIG